MTVATAVLNRLVQAIVAVYKSGLSIPGAFAPPSDPHSPVSDRRLRRSAPRRDEPRP